MAKYHNYIREAIEKGCWFDFETGEFVSHTGNRVIPKLYGKQRYPATALNKSKSFPIHKFVAYILYGEESFKGGVEVRHLDGNTLNLAKSNLLLGSSSENQLDKAVSDRRNAASTARLAQPRPTNAKLKPEDVRDIRGIYNDMKKLHPNKLPNGSLTMLAEKFKVSTHCIESVIYNKLWRDIDV